MAHHACTTGVRCGVEVMCGGQLWGGGLAEGLLALHAIHNSSTNQ